MNILIKHAFNLLGITSTLLLLATKIIDLVFPYHQQFMVVTCLLAGWWGWTQLDNIRNLKIQNYLKYRPFFERLFLISLGYLLARQTLFSTDAIFQLPQLMSFFRFVNLPLLILFLSGLAAVILNKPQATIIDWLDKKITDKQVIIVMLVFIIAGFGLRAYKLGASDIRGDEFQVIGAATGYLYTGEFYRWNWIDGEPGCLDLTSGSCVYTRAWPHTWMIAQTYKLLGISETTSRIPSLIFGIFLIGVAYLLGQYFTKSRTLALWTAGFTTIATSYISLSRYTRMYAILLPIFGLLVYFVLRTLHEKYPLKSQLSNSTLQKLYNFLPYHYLFGIFALILLYFNYHIHVNSLVILPAILIFVLILAGVYKKYRYIFPAIVGLLGSLGGIWFVLSGRFRFSGMLSWWGRNNRDYLRHIYDFPLGYQLFVIFCLLALFSILLYWKKHKISLPLKRVVFIPVLLGFGTIFFIYFADRYAAFVYSSHLTLFALIGSLILVSLLIRHFSKLGQLFFVGMVVSMGLVPLVTAQAEKYHSQGEAKHSVAYRVIIDNYNPETDVLFAQYARNYYLRGIDNPSFISMERNKTYEFEKFLIDASSSERIWAAWESGKGYHLQDIIKAFIDARFEKLHGRGIDDTRVEVYFCPDATVCLADIDTFMATYYQTQGLEAQPELPEQTGLEEEDIE